MHRIFLSLPQHRVAVASAAVGGVTLGAFLSSCNRRPAEATPRTTSDTVRPVVVCGPSGVGKGTLINMLLEEFGDKVDFSVSHTTRKPRPGEVDGKHYHFTSKYDMEKMIENGEFVEYARVHGNLYGTSKSAVNAVASEGKVCVLDIDVQGTVFALFSSIPKGVQFCSLFYINCIGAKSVYKAALDAYFLFIMPPSMEELERRLRGRGTESEEAIQKRLVNAKGELAQTNLPIWDAKLVNFDKKETYNEVRRLIVANCM